MFCYEEMATDRQPQLDHFKQLFELFFELKLNQILQNLIGKQG